MSVYVNGFICTVLRYGNADGDIIRASAKLVPSYDWKFDNRLVDWNMLVSREVLL